MKKYRLLRALTIIITLGVILSCCGCASKEAKAVKQLIKDIGTVTLDSKDAIIVAEVSYSALSESDKKAVSNYDDLVAAKETYEDLVSRKTFIELAETIKKSILGKRNLESSFESNYDSKTAICNFFTDISLEDVQENVKYNRASLYNTMLATYVETVEDILSTYRNHQLMGIQTTVNVYLDDKETLLFSVTEEETATNLFQTLHDEKISSIQVRDSCVFRNVKWGDTYETVLENETAEVLVDEKDGLMFTVEFADHTSDYMCWFDENEVLTGIMVAANEDFYGDDCFSCFQAYKDELTSMYGTPHTDKRVVTDSLAKYTDEIGALQLGFAQYVVQWETNQAKAALAMYADGYNDIVVAFKIEPGKNANSEPVEETLQIEAPEVTESQNPTTPPVSSNPPKPSSQTPAASATNTSSPISTAVPSSHTAKETTSTPTTPSLTEASFQGMWVSDTIPNNVYQIFEYSGSNVRYESYYKNGDLEWLEISTGTFVVEDAVYADKALRIILSHEDTYYPDGTHKEFDYPKHDGWNPRPITEFTGTSYTTSNALTYLKTTQHPESPLSSWGFS